MKGSLRYYDKEQEENIEVPLPFTFLFLDQLGTIKGWHDQSESGIYSNEVKRIDRDPLTVKAFNGGVLAEGLYSQIKDSVKAKGGKYVASVYIAFKDEGELVIGNIGLKGAALSAWMDFTRQAGGRINEKAVVVKDFEEGQKGSITYRVPVFKLKETSEDTNQKAIELDKALQEYLENRLTVVEEPEEVEGHNITPPHQGEQPPLPTDEELASVPGDIDDDLPF